MLVFIHIRIHIFFQWCLWYLSVVIYAFIYLSMQWFIRFALRLKYLSMFTCFAVFSFVSGWFCLHRVVHGFLNYWLSEMYYWFFITFIHIVKKILSISLHFSFIFLFFPLFSFFLLYRLSGVFIYYFFRLAFCFFYSAVLSCIIHRFSVLKNVIFWYDSWSYQSFFYKSFFVSFALVCFFVSLKTRKCYMFVFILLLLPVTYLFQSCIHIFTFVLLFLYHLLPYIYNFQLSFLSFLSTAAFLSLIIHILTFILYLPPLSPCFHLAI